MDGLGGVLFQYPFRQANGVLRASPCIVLANQPTYTACGNEPSALAPSPPSRVPAYYALILRSLTVLEGLALTVGCCSPASAC